MKLSCASFFAGVGGIDKGFELSGFTPIFANELDKYAVETFKMNFNNVTVINDDIRKLDAKRDIPSFDVMLGGFPCQAFSIAGYRQGFEDERGRGNLFFELLRIIKEKQPKVVFLENVKHLLGHDGGNTMSTIISCLKDEGYYVTYKVLSAVKHGDVPQARERIYIVCFKNETAFKKFRFPDEIPLSSKLEDVIDFHSNMERKFYYKNDWKHFDKLNASVVKSNTCYQWRRVYVRENKAKVCPTLTANMGTGGHNVPIIRTYSGEIRKLTPRECFLLQGFPKDFILPEKMSNTNLYKQAGNSVTVSVIQRIAKNIYDALTLSSTI